MKKITSKIKKQIVNLADRSYPLYYGTSNLQILPKILNQHKIPKKILIVTDKNVDKLFGHNLHKILEPTRDIKWTVIPASEKYKTLETISRLYDECVKAKMDKSSCILAFGGGVVQDIANYLAATFARGVPFVQVPTTLISQADTGLGGCSINHPAGKSLIGTFYQPKLVYTDTQFLEGLPPIHISNGLAEVINKIVCLGGRNFEPLKKDIPLMMERNPFVLQKYIILSNQIKREIIQKDEVGLKGSRFLLDFGHTITYALERLVDYKILHGIALGIGMYGEALISNTRGHISNKDIETLRQIISLAELPSQLPVNTDTKKLLKLMYYDQKVVNGRIQFVLLRSFGIPFLSFIKEEEILKTLNTIKGTD